MPVIMLYQCVCNTGNLEIVTLQILEFLGVLIHNHNPRTVVQQTVEQV